MTPERSITPCTGVPLKSRSAMRERKPDLSVTRFRLGVVNTGVGYDTFDIRPQTGNLHSVSGKVPVPGGYVTVQAEKDRVEVFRISRVEPCTGKEKHTRWKKGKHWLLKNNTYTDLCSCLYCDGVILYASLKGQ